MFANRLAALAVVLGALGATAGLAAQDPAANTDARVRAAIVAAITSRVGPSAEIQMDALEVVVTNQAAGTLVATPDPAGRTGQTIRFNLTVPGVRPGGGGIYVGRATALVTVSADHLRSRRAVARGAVIQADDVEVVHDGLTGMPLRRVAALADVVGGRAARDWAAGVVVTAEAVIPTQTVRSGDRVRVLARIGDVEAETSGMAVDSGMTGRVIRIVNPETRRTMRARVVGSGQVEVIR